MNLYRKNDVVKNIINTAILMIAPLVLLSVVHTSALAIDFQPPVADFTYSNDQLTVTFEDTSTDPDTVITEWYWDLGDGNHEVMKTDFQHSYQYSGTYTVTLEVVDFEGLRDTVTKEVVVDGPAPAAPEAYFTTYRSNYRVSFTDKSTDADDAIVERYWDLGDGSHESMKTSFYHDYTYNGTYTITLEVVDEMGNRDTYSKDVTTTGGTSLLNPKANFTYVINGNDVTFTDTSTDADNEIAEWYWDLGDGNHMSMTQSFTHTYAFGAQPYNVSLEVVDATGLRNTKTIAITPEGPGVENPTASFASYYNDTVSFSFTDESTTSNGSIVEKYWDLGDGTFAENVNEVLHTYTRNGTYEVKLEVVDELGLRDTYVDYIDVTGIQVYEPYVAFEKTVVYGSLDVSFSDISYSGNGSIIERYWDLGDGTHVEMEQNVSHTYAQSGVYVVKLEVVDALGVRGTFQEEIVIVGTVTGDAESYFTYYSESLTPTTITFYDGSTSPNGPITEWYWDLGDGTFVSNEKVVEHTFTSAGIYTVKLEVVDIAGSRSTYQVVFFMYPWYF